jgi:Zn-dependent protease
MNAAERNDLLISWITLSLAFSLLISDDFFSIMSIAQAIPIALVAVGTGFVCHEMAHRQAARHFGYHAEYRAWTNGLILAVAMAIISGGRFIFAAPGATYIFAHNIPAKQNGQISFAGPATNIVIGFLLLFFSFLAVNQLMFDVLFYSAWINFWFAFFNLLPIGPLDGGKVMNWNRGVWALGLLLAAAMAFFPNMVYFLVYLLVA